MRKPMASLPEHQIYVFATSIMAAFFVAAIFRLWLLRREEERLLKNKAALEKQVLSQQKDLMTVKQETNAWRTEMQRQFDIFRHMASDQLSVEEKRFNDLLSKSQQRERELLTHLDLTKQMCAELPDAKARILHLESLLEKALSQPSPPQGSNPDDSDEDGGLPVPAPVSPMPDLSGGDSPAPAPTPVEETPAPAPAPSPFFPPKFASPPPPPSPLAAILPITESSLPVLDTEPVNTDKVAELEEKLAAAEKKNLSLQLVLTKTRLRSRTQHKRSRASRPSKRALVLQA